MQENEIQKNYNQWYWEVVAIPSMNRILTHYKSRDRNLKLTASRENLIPMLKYLKAWEENNEIDETIKHELFLIRNFEGYEHLIAA
jgi:hypothetical protein